MRVLVTGSRDWTDRLLLNEALDEINRHVYKTPLVIVHGDCPTGADKMAKDWAIANGVEHEPHPADWDRYKKSAGPIRNSEMVALGADVCYAFPLPQSRGTIDCMNKAMRAGILVTEIRP